MSSHSIFCKYRLSCSFYTCFSSRTLAIGNSWAKKAKICDDKFVLSKCCNLVLSFHWFWWKVLCWQLLDTNNCQCSCESQSSNSLGFPAVSCYLPTRASLDLEAGLLFTPFNTVPLSSPCENARQTAHLMSELWTLPPQVSCSQH